METNTQKMLPICCWEMIFDKLNQPSDRYSISLVCKEYLSITDLIQDTFTVVSPSIRLLTNLLHRFPHLKKIQLVRFQGNLSRAIHVISQSGLNLEELDVSCNTNLPDVCLQNLGSAMKNLKVLNCSLSCMKDFDLAKIANFFPQLEEINISDSDVTHIVDGKITAVRPVTDEGIEFLASKLKRLRKIDLSGNQCISDKSLISLSLNCPFLQQIKASYGMNITEFGISSLFHNSSRLTGLCLMAQFMIGSLGGESFSNYPKYLGSLKFFSLNISDEFLHSVAKAEIPLTELTLSFCKCYTYSGISSLLRSRRSLKSLALLGADFLCNEHIDYLCQFLLNLSSIQLHFCPRLSDSAFVMLSERCKLLSRVDIGYSGLGREEWNEHPVKNFEIRSLNLSSNQYMGSANLRKVLRICPNLEDLKLSKCFQGTKLLDVADILDYSHTVESLELTECRHMRFSGEKAKKVLKLENLVAKYSGINDEILVMIGRISPGLLYLDLENCESITEKGLKEVVESCKRLRYLNLSGCSNVNVDVVEYIVQTVPSLRSLISPS